MEEEVVEEEEVVVVEVEEPAQTITTTAVALPQAVARGAKKTTTVSRMVGESHGQPR